ncbi:hypothetical protein [Leucobacter chromiiresistens]|uniref:Uncharacterized protein n=1 Tax=Leucobacter chromiiresistens TaxID=1079994 RepID=A0A1H0Y8T5_9MICO|nr:hypothetical protein [Leucobacter chromiiresistens]SDQ11522.1 hypothetical protein SAMN04488565_0633 [Leucobacter chromiiresistens]
MSTARSVSGELILAVADQDAAKIHTLLHEIATGHLNATTVILELAAACAGLAELARGEGWRDQMNLAILATQVDSQLDDTIRSEGME